MVQQTKQSANPTGRRMRVPYGWLYTATLARHIDREPPDCSDSSLEAERASGANVAFWAAGAKQAVSSGIGQTESNSAPVALAAAGTAAGNHDQSAISDLPAVFVTQHSVEGAVEVMSSVPVDTTAPCATVCPPIASTLTAEMSLLVKWVILAERWPLRAAIFLRAAEHCRTLSGEPTWKYHDGRRTNVCGLARWVRTATYRHAERARLQATERGGDAGQAAAVGAARQEELENHFDLLRVARDDGHPVEQMFHVVISRAVESLECSSEDFPGASTLLDMDDSESSFDEVFASLSATPDDADHLVRILLRHGFLDRPWDGNNLLFPGQCGARGDGPEQYCSLTVLQSFVGSQMMVELQRLEDGGALDIIMDSNTLANFLRTGEVKKLSWTAGTLEQQLFDAVSGGETETALALVKAGADVAAIDKRGRSIWHHLVAMGQSRTPHTLALVHFSSARSVRTRHCNGLSGPNTPYSAASCCVRELIFLPLSARVW